VRLGLHTVKPLEGQEKTFILTTQSSTIHLRANNEEEYQQWTKALEAKVKLTSFAVQIRRQKTFLHRLRKEASLS
jgi:hypothetical protein